MSYTSLFKQNVNFNERIASGLAGAALIVLGLVKRGFAGWLTTAIGSALFFRGASGHCQLYKALGVSTAPIGTRSSRISVPGNRGIKIEKMFFVERSPAELFRTWRNFENLPHFMKHLESVQMLDEKRSHWIARGPAGRRVEWDAEVINEHPNEMIAWRSLDGDVDHAGTVRFQPAAGGTEVRISLEYDLPGGAVGAAVSKLFFEEPARQIEADMQRFKQMMEAAG